MFDGLIAQRNKFENARFGIDSLISLEVLYQIPRIPLVALIYSAELKLNMTMLPDYSIR